MSTFERLYELGVPHNTFSITLPDGSYFPSHIKNDDVRPTEFLTQFNRVRSRPWEDCRFMDLACSEGSTTIGLGQMESSVVGVEGRADAIDRARVLASICRFDKVEFNVGNVTSPDVYRDVDGIFNAGILYHLDNPLACLELCAKHARDFIYLDTGHMPRSEEEKRKSKFAKALRNVVTFTRAGREIKGMEYTEPANIHEDQGDLRRGPRSAIGISTAIWLNHADVVEYMSDLGFGYHAVLADRPKIPRLVTCFFRLKPSEPVALTLRRPLAKGLPMEEARAVTRLRDLAHIRQNKLSITVLGWEPHLQAVAAYLEREGVDVPHRVEIPGEEGRAISASELNQLVPAGTTYLAIATQKPNQVLTKLAMIQRLNYIYSCF